MEIPKIIHQIWIGPKKIPHEVIDTVQNNFMEKYNDFQYIFWDENEIDKHKEKFKLYPLYHICETYNGMANLIRLDILYNFGGIYVDADTVYTNNTIDFRKYFETDKNIIISKSPDNKNFPNGFIGCTQYNNIFKNIIDDLLYEYIPYIPSCESTGPYFITKYIEKNLDSIEIIPSKLIYPTNWHNNKQKIMENIHEIREKYNDSLFFQIGFSTCKINIDIDTTKTYFYRCLHNNNALYPFYAIDEYILTQTRKKNISKQLEFIYNESSEQKIKKPIIYLDERLCDSIRNTHYEYFKKIIHNCEFGIFLHMGSSKYSNKENLSNLLTDKLNMFDTKPIYLLVYLDPYKAKLKFDYNLSGHFKKTKLISRNSKILNSYFIR